MSAKHKLQRNKESGIYYVRIQIGNQRKRFAFGKCRDKARTALRNLEREIKNGNIQVESKSPLSEVSGSKIMLIDGQQEDKQEINNILSAYLTDYGIELSKTSEKLAEFNSVTNTYLSVFLALGGLGVLIGTIGLSIVILRNIIERKNEMALLLAIGYKQKHIKTLLLIEKL